MLAGIGIYGVISGQTSFNLRFKFIVGTEITDVSSQEIITAEVDKDTHIYPVILKDVLVEVPAGTSFTVCVSISAQ